MHFHKLILVRWVTLTESENRKTRPMKSPAVLFWLEAIRVIQINGIQNNNISILKQIDIACIFGYQIQNCINFSSWLFFSSPKIISFFAITIPIDRVLSANKKIKFQFNNKTLSWHTFSTNWSINRYTNGSHI